MNEAKGDEMAIRSFVAIELGEPLREKVARLRESSGLGLEPLRWVDAKNVHLTLKFLGDVEEDIVPGVLERLGEACGDVAPFDMTLSGLGSFPPGRPPRVVWVGVAEEGGAENVRRLASRIDKSLEPLGFERERAEARPHVTLARAKDGARRVSLERASATGVVGSARVESVALKASRLTPSGPVYSTLGEVPLGGARP